MQGYGAPKFHWTTGKVIKILLGINVVLYICQLIAVRVGIPIQALYMTPTYVESGALWQFFTYMFFHDPSSMFHILFNMLVLWMIGSELETVWGPKYFLKYYLSCGVGAGIFYYLVSFIFLQNSANYSVPMLGASGAIYGLLLAYGILFSERVLHFMMIFPMKAKYFVMLLGGIELISTVLRPQSTVANAAHLGGLVVGAFVLWITVIFAQRKKGSGSSQKGGKKKAKDASHLRLVGDTESFQAFEDEDSDSNKPTWH